MVQWFKRALQQVEDANTESEWQESLDSAVQDISNIKNINS
jgi:hypothetical protein